VIRLLKALATPLVFLVVVNAFCRAAVAPRQAGKLLAITTLNAAVAAVIALSIANLLPVGRAVDLSSLQAAIGEGKAPEAPKALDPMGTLKGLIPQSLLEPFASNHVLSVALLALLVGIALRQARQAEVLVSGVQAALDVLTTLLGWVIRAIPIAVFGVVAKVVGASGFSVFAALGAFVGVVALGLAIHVLVYYALVLRLAAGVSPAGFFRRGSEALSTAFATGSSLATLPVTLRTLRGRMGVSAESASLAACVGTNLNNDGILLYEAVAAIFVAQLHGIAMPLDQQLWMCLVSALAAMGIAGVPEAGFITLSVVLTAVGLPLTALPLLLPVDWLIGRLRATTNVASDMVVATLLDRGRRD
jgi:Na+/H+-dicarboxylate symporter